ncbi:hypothetical protein Y1Q_0009376 [Alligator mississippiensis]|uniref:Uncharacterized protein n=1 Tax=Alligator mississippiensis TaxID=8496 RepID=A0A151N7I3_ALLMI|nr:hypothetical protein Y1Q_0009376 [Alligator mississippiensis]
MLGREGELGNDPLGTFSSPFLKPDSSWIVVPPLWPCAEDAIRDPCTPAYLLCRGHHPEERPALSEVIF